MKKRETRACLECGTVFSCRASVAASGDGKYCSMGCYLAFLAGPSHPRRRMPPWMVTCLECQAVFESSRSRNKKGKRKFCSTSCNLAWNRKHKGPTGIEKKMAVLLDMLGVKYEAEKPFPGIGIVDFYLPEQHIAVEVDGGYWHRTVQIRAKDARKDESLSAYGIKVIRVPGTDLGEQRPPSEQRSLRFGSR